MSSNVKSKRKVNDKVIISSIDVLDDSLSDEISLLQRLDYFLLIRLVARLNPKNLDKV